MFFNQSSTLLSISGSSTFGILSLTFSYTLFSNSFACAGCMFNRELKKKRLQNVGE